MDSRRFFSTNGHANVECKITIGRNVDFTRSSALISISSAFKCGGVLSEHLKPFPRSLFHAPESRNNPLLFESRCCRTIGTSLSIVLDKASKKIHTDVFIEIALNFASSPYISRTIKQ